jgi:hypothetical protein
VTQAKTLVELAWHSYSRETYQTDGQQIPQRVLHDTLLETDTVEKSDAAASAIKKFSQETSRSKDGQHWNQLLPEPGNPHNRLAEDTPSWRFYLYM